MDKQLLNQSTRYVAPSFRFMNTCLEHAFLNSNTEPIDGGDDPDIPW